MGPYISTHKKPKHPKPKIILNIDIFTYILKFCSIHDYFNVITTSKLLREQYWLNSGYVMEYIKYNIGPIHYNSLLDHKKIYKIHALKLSIEKNMADNKMIKLSGIQDHELKREIPTYNLYLMREGPLQALNITSSLLMEKYNGNLVLIPISNDTSSVTLPLENFKLFDSKWLKKGELDLWFKINT
jgi:hypothetical protein